MAGRGGSIAQVSSRTEAGSGDKRGSRFTPRIWRPGPDHQKWPRARILRDWARDRGDGPANGLRGLALLAARGQVSVPATPQSGAAKPSLSCPITGPAAGPGDPRPV